MWASHFIATMISVSVAPLACFIIGITSAFLLARPVLGLLAGFRTRPAFCRGLGFLGGCARNFRLDAFFSDSIEVLRLTAGPSFIV